MNTKTLSSRAMSIIDQYLHFKTGSAVCSIPYFNNKSTGARGGLSVHRGKGSPKEIFDEVETIALKSRVPLQSLADESLKKLLVDNNIGIDCSGFAYYVLNAESQERGKGSLDKHLSFVQAHGIVGKIASALRPARTTGVATFAHDRNSRVVPLAELEPGDIITMTAGPEGPDRDHILVIHQIEYQNFVPNKIHYSQSVAYPEDGLYGTGVKQGTIELADPFLPLSEALWTENGLTGTDNRMYMRSKKSQTETRRLKWW